MYKVDIKCNNCGTNKEYSIPKGTPVDDFKKETICSYCGCILVAWWGNHYTTTTYYETTTNPYEFIRHCEPTGDDPYRTWTTCVGY